MDLDTYDILQEGRVPLSKKVTLSWLGWTAEGVSMQGSENGSQELIRVGTGYI